MTKQEARDILKWFKKNIGLMGWNIDITIGPIPPKELGGDILPNDRNDFCGRNITFTQFHRVVIWINPGAHEKDVPMIDSEEATLFHELLHCFNYEVGLEENGFQCEWAINRLSCALLRLYRFECGQD